MFYVIQTNTILNNYDEPMDFQSFMYKIEDKTWEEFKKYITSDESNSTIFVKGTLKGLIKPTHDEAKEIIINDEIHLEVVFHSKKFNFNTNVKFYKVTENNFRNLIE